MVFRNADCCYRVSTLMAIIDARFCEERVRCEYLQVSKSVIVMMTVQMICQKENQLQSVYVKMMAKMLNAHDDAMMEMQYRIQDVAILVL